MMKGHCSAHYPLLGAIDIGTNSCRLLVASVNVARLHGALWGWKQSLRGWKVVDSFARIVRLGEGLSHSCKLSDASMQRTLDALAVCRRKIDFHEVFRIRAVATEACRRASNAQQLIDEIYERLKLRIEIISGEEEARLILTGCAGVLNYKIPYGVVFDIGGGSTEAIWLQIDYDAKRRPGYPIPFKVLDAVSLPYGVVTSTESLQGFGNALDLHEYIRSQVRYEIENFAQRNKIHDYMAKGQVQLLGSSGTVTTLAAVQANLPRYERRFIDSICLNIADLRRVSQEILHMTPDERMQNPCIGKGRSDLIIIGSSILEGIFDALPLEEVFIADRGVREGILSELLLDLHKNVPANFDPL